MNIQMIGRLINELKMPPIEKERGQLRLGLFAVGKRRKRTPEQILVQFQQRKLPQKLPLFRHGTDCMQNIHRKLGFVAHIIGK